MIRGKKCTKYRHANIAMLHKKVLIYVEHAVFFNLFLSIIILFLWKKKRFLNSPFDTDIFVADLEASLFLSDPPAEPISSCRDESGYVPTVGRWGSEWPSWLENKDVRDAPHLAGPSEWPDGHPLPLPSWGSPKEALKVPTVELYEELAASVELTVQQLLPAHHYNSVGNLLRWVSIGFTFKYLFLK